STASMARRQAISKAGFVRAAPESTASAEPRRLHAGELRLFRQRGSGGPRAAAVPTARAAAANGAVRAEWAAGRGYEASPGRLSGEGAPESDPEGGRQPVRLRHSRYSDSASCR